MRDNSCKWGKTGPTSPPKLAARDQDQAKPLAANALDDRGQCGHGCRAVAAAVVEDDDRAGADRAEHAADDRLRRHPLDPVGWVDRPEHDALAQLARDAHDARRDASPGRAEQPCPDPETREDLRSERDL